MGRKDDAVRYLRLAMEAGAPFDFMGWHTDPTVDSLRDYPPFMALMAPKG